MKDCPPFICKQIMEVIRNKNVFLYEETTDTLVDKVNKINKDNLYGVFVHLTVQNDKVNEVNEIVKKVIEILKDKKVRFSAGLKSNDHEKVLLFVSYNKKESENADDKK